ncbi:MAG: oligosaccharide flippase family protein, partial [Deltaproteobacteria bacterium]|nr:oligosaccharide flippase family protein [Deltaproteobacteria bacterium]
MSEAPAAPQSESQPPAAPVAVKQHDAVKVTRGLAAMVFSQLVTVPLSMLVTSVLARKLGPLDFGAMYLATTAAKLAFLFVEWGQSNSMAGAVARDRSVAPRLLGTSVALKLVFGTIALGVLIGVGRLLGYTPEAKLAVIFIAVQATLGTCIGSGQAVLRGYERQDIVSGLGLYGNLVESGSVLTLALLGTGLAGVLWGGVIGKAMGIIPLVILLRRFKIGRPVVRREAVGELLHLGFAFLMFDLVLALQPYIDAMVLNRNAPAEVMGWHAATQRLTGVLIFPSSALGIAMYPTLARLSRESPAEHVAMMRDGLRLMVLGSVPAAVGVIVFARPVIHALYGSTD